MSCDETQSALVAYHFGIVSDEERRAVEEHLLDCRSCLAAFLALKRDLETAESSPRPSPALRARLRRAVAGELGIAEQQPARSWSWWERPLAFAFAGAAVLAAVFAFNLLSSRGGSPPHGLRERPAAGDSVRDHN